MTKTMRHPANLALTLVLLIVAVVLPAPGQSADTLSRQSVLGPALQFQLVGGVGLNYLSQVDASGFWRIGVDISLSLSNSSGDGVNSYISGGSYTTHTATRSKGKPVSYELQASAIYVWQSREYARTSLYAGAGPVVFYSYSKNETESTEIRSESGSLGPTTITYTSESKSRDRGLGALAIFGARCRVVDQLSLCAEYGFTAAHHWVWTGDASRSTGYLSTGGTGGSSNRTSRMWMLSLSTLRLGIVIGL